MKANKTPPPISPSGTDANRWTRSLIDGGDFRYVPMGKHTCWAGMTSSGEAAQQIHADRKPLTEEAFMIAYATATISNGRASFEKVVSTAFC